ncbi:MAG: hypothetical protein K2X39_06715 [Silvanigrellaceae bacterium]|nr:hypothetical protein [Silvanigrellaceae bacterium]
MKLPWLNKPVLNNKNIDLSLQADPGWRGTMDSISKLRLEIQDEIFSVKDFDQSTISAVQHFFYSITNNELERNIFKKVILESIILHSPITSDEYKKYADRFYIATNIRAGIPKTNYDIYLEKCRDEDWLNMSKVEAALTLYHTNVTVNRKQLYYLFFCERVYFLF